MSEQGGLTNDETKKLSAVMGEAYMIRSYHHFILAQVFCMPYRGPELSKSCQGIPYITKPETTVKPHYERGTLAETYEKIEKDLVLSQGKNARMVELESKEEEKVAHDLFLLTNKPVLYVCNVDDTAAADGNAYVEAVREAVKDENAQILVIAAQTESEIAELETYEERQMFLQEIGLEESGVNRLIKSAYALLNLETFLTAGPKEVRAWTFHKGSKAPQCAGVIHSDFERGFIRAEIIKYEDYIAYGSEAAVKEAGKMHIEGKEYVFQDGDIVVFRFNV